MISKLFSRLLPVLLASMVWLNTALGQCDPYPCAPCVLPGNAVSTSTNCGNTYKITVTLDLPAGHMASYVIKKAGQPQSLPVNTTSSTYTFLNLTPGTYYVWAFDLTTGCLWTGQCEFLGLFDTSIDFGSFCGGDNYICAYAVGGTQPYTYVWNDGYVSVFDGCRYNLPAGNYSVTITDGSGNTNCKKVETATVYNWQNPVITTTTKNPTCLKSNGEIKINVTGSGPFNVTMVGPNFNQSGTSFTGLAPGTYTINVMDVNGCTSSKNVQLQNVGEPKVTLIDTASCNPIYLNGQFYTGSDTFTVQGFTPQGCASDTVYQITISDTITGPTTKIVVCPGGLTLNGTHYSTTGQYELFDFVNGCPRVSILDLTVLDLNATIVTHIPVCEEKDDLVEYLFTQDSCPYSRVTVYDLAISPDSTIHLDACNIAFADSSYTETRYNLAGCPYLFTTEWCYAPKFETSIESSCIDSLIGTSKIDTLEKDGCTVILTTTFYPGQSSWATKSPITVCPGDVVVFGNTETQIWADTLLHTTGMTTLGCLVDSFQQVSVKYPQTIWTPISTCNPDFKDSTRFDGFGPGDCPDLLYTYWLVYQLPDVWQPEPTCDDQLVGDTTKIVAYTNENCPYNLYTVYTGYVPETVDTIMALCAGSEMFWRGEMIVIRQDTVLRDTITLPSGCKQYKNCYVSAEPPKETFLNPAVICPGDLFTFEGDTLGPFPPGSEVHLEKLLQTQLGCDSLVRQVIFTLNESSDTTEIVVCPKDSAEFNGQKYPAGTFSFPTLNCGVRTLIVIEIDGDVLIDVSNDFNGQIGDSVPSFEVSAQIVDPYGVPTNTAFKTWRVMLENSPCSQKWEDWASVTYCGQEYFDHRTVTLGWSAQTAQIEFPANITLSVPDHIDSTSFNWWFDNAIQGYEVFVPIPSGQFSLTEEITFLNDTLARRDFIVATPCDTFTGFQMITLRYPPVPPVVQCDVIVKLVGDVVVIDILKNVTDNGITLSDMKFTIWETRSGTTQTGDLKPELNEIPLLLNMLNFKMYIAVIRATGSDGNPYIVVPRYHNPKTKGIGICRP